MQDICGGGWCRKNQDGGHDCATEASLILHAAYVWCMWKRWGFDCTLMAANLLFDTLPFLPIPLRWVTTAVKQWVGGNSCEGQLVLWEDWLNHLVHFFSLALEVSIFKKIRKKTFIFLHNVWWASCFPLSILSSNLTKLILKMFSLKTFEADSPAT